MLGRELEVSPVDIVTVLVDPILPIFAIMAIGFAVGRVGWTTEAEARVINRFGLSVLLPVFLFGFGARVDLHSFDPLPILTYLGAELLIFGCGFLLANKILKRSTGEALLLAMTGVVANNAFYVLPIAIQLYGSQAVNPFFAITAIDALVGFSAIIIALDLLQRQSLSVPALGSSIARSPVIMALVAGFCYSATGLTIPPPVETFLGFTGVAAAPVSLFALGVVLSRTVFRFDVTVISFTLIKLAVFPLTVFLCLRGVAYGGEDTRIYLLSAAGPSVAMSFSLALLYDIPTDRLAQIMVWSGLLSLLSLSVLA